MVIKKFSYFFGFLFLFFLPFSVLAAALTAPSITTVAGDQGKMIVAGVTSANTEVMVYIDGKFAGSAVVDEIGKTETGKNFSFLIPNDLEVGEHTTFVAAKDKDSFDLSPFSEEFEFFVKTPKVLEPAITSVAVEEKEPVVDMDKTEIDDTGALNSLELPTSGAEEETGSIDEQKENQSKLRWNLIIFLSFLIAVIGWIFWVNRELIKEKEAANSKKDKDNSDLEI